ncbi:DNA polymerase III subunit beta [Bacillus sp. AK128]
MEFKINSDYLNKAIVDVTKAVSSKTTLPVLTGIKIIAKTDHIMLIGSNSEIIIERKVPECSDGGRMLEVFQTGSVVIPAKYFSEITKKLPGDIYIKAKHDHTVTIQSEDIISKLNGFSGEEFPSLPELQASQYFRVTSDQLVEMIKQTVFATSKNETRPVLTGVNFSFEEDLLTCVATNSHRLALRKCEVSSELRGSFIVPSSALHEFVKLFGSNKTDINIFANETTILFKSHNLSLYSRLIEGVYPNVSSLIPEETSTIITLDTNQLLRGIDRASIFASEWKNNNINFRLSEGSKIIMATKSTEMGQIEETQPVKKILGDGELTITLDGNFMMDALKAIKEVEVQLCFQGTMRPILVIPVGNDSYLQLISPVRSS